VRLWPSYLMTAGLGRPVQCCVAQACDALTLPHASPSPSPPTPWGPDGLLVQTHTPPPRAASGHLTGAGGKGAGQELERLRAGAGAGAEGWRGAKGGTGAGAGQEREAGGHSLCLLRLWRRRVHGELLAVLGSGGAARGVTMPSLPPGCARLVSDTSSPHPPHPLPGHGH